jgi:hypothetical protein
MERMKLTAPTLHDAPTALFLARRIFVDLYPFIILPREALRGLLAWQRAHGCHASWCV